MSATIQIQGDPVSRHSRYAPISCGHPDSLLQSRVAWSRVSARGAVGTFYDILADPPKPFPRIAQAVDEESRNWPIPTKTESERAFALGFIGFLGNVKALLLIISGAVTVHHSAGIGQHNCDAVSRCAKWGFSRPWARARNPGRVWEKQFHLVHRRPDRLRLGGIVVPRGAPRTGAQRRPRPASTGAVRGGGVSGRGSDHWFGELIHSAWGASRLSPVGSAAEFGVG